MKHKKGCLLCGKELIYLQSSENAKCVYCSKTFRINEQCIDGHYVCDNCHSSDAMDIITDFCLNTSSTNPYEIATTLMYHPSVKMHGPEHHFLVPAVLLAVFYNVTGEKIKLTEKLLKARKRAELLPGGFCGSHGNCGAGVGTGIFISLISNSTPLSMQEWKLSNLMTSKSLYEIALKGGPRCCKRDVFLSLTEAVKFVNENFNIEIPIENNIICDFSELNKECLLEKCIFYNHGQEIVPVPNKKKELTMQTSEEIKNTVKEKYSQIAVANQSCGCSCCGTEGVETFDYTVMSDDYSKLDGYVPDADLGLGCGIPTAFADMKEGNTVLDLGSGAGNDVFIARQIVGEKGKVIGLDFTDEMIEKARLNNDKLRYNNVEFRKGDIENMPVGAAAIDVVISNCVLNLVPDKVKAFSEIFRVLKPGGHFCVSDIVLNGKDRKSVV